MMDLNKALIKIAEKFVDPSLLFHGGRWICHAIDRIFSDSTSTYGDTPEQAVKAFCEAEGIEI